MLTRVSQLTPAQLADIESLLLECQQHDGNFIPIYKHLIDKRHPLACNILYYLDKKLVGYLRSFFFYTNACEMAVMVSPAYRRQKIAAKMLQEILPVLSGENIYSLIFSTPPTINDQWLTSLGYRYRNSECHLQYDPQKKITILIKPANIRNATSVDIPIMCDIDDACFPNKKENPVSVFQGLLQANNCSLFVLVDHDEIVGKAHLFIESDRVRLTDIAVLPKAQGHGFGAALVKHCINHALIRNKTRIVLDVETNNERALKLYQGLGFNIINTHDYWVSPEHAKDFGLEMILREISS